VTALLFSSSFVQTQAPLLAARLRESVALERALASGDSTDPAIPNVGPECSANPSKSTMRLERCRLLQREKLNEWGAVANMGVHVLLSLVQFVLAWACKASAAPPLRASCWAAARPSSWAPSSCWTSGRRCYSATSQVLLNFIILYSSACEYWCVFEVWPLRMPRICLGASSCVGRLFSSLTSCTLLQW
jgi:hypothetical protein